MSVVKLNADNPNTEALASVGPGVNQGNPDAIGLHGIPCTRGSEGTLSVREGADVMPLARVGAIIPADVSVRAFAPVNERQGVLPTTTTATTTLPTTQRPTTPSNLNANVTNFLTHNCTTALTASAPSVQSGNEHSRPGNLKYSLYLPQGAPLALPCDIPDAAAILQNNQNTSSTVALGEKAILEISQDGVVIQMILNSVLSFVNKSVDEGLKTDDIIKLLIGHYNEKLITESADLARSLLRKEDRPKRKNAKNQTSVSLKMTVIAKKLISMVKTLRKKFPHIVFASYGLNVPLKYATNDINVARENISRNNNSNTSGADMCDNPMGNNNIQSQVKCQSGSLLIGCEQKELQSKQERNINLINFESPVDNAKKNGNTDKNNNTVEITSPTNLYLLDCDLTCETVNNNNTCKLKQVNDVLLCDVKSQRHDAKLPPCERCNCVQQ